MTEVTVDDLSKVYGTGSTAERAVDDVSFTAEDGEFLTLVGPSGCGKTSVLRCLAGLESITSGEVRFDGELMNDVIPQRREVAMIFQQPALYAHMTAADNILYPLKIRKVPEEERQKRLEQAASVLQIEEHLDKNPPNMSGGQQQRVALARCLVQQPKVFLLDEPTSDLDAKLRVEIRKEIQKVAKETGQTMIYVTHDQEEAMTMSDRVIVMDDGDIQQVGRPETVYDQPDNTFVASFMGTPAMNLFDGYKRSDVIEIDGIGRIPLDGHDVDTPDGDYLVGFRPEAVQLSPDGGLGGEVDLVEPIGHGSIVYVQTTNGELRTMTTRDTGTLQEGENVRLSVPGSDVILFDTETDERVWPATVDEVRQIPG